MQFQDELAGGIVLVRPALRSPNYVAGSTGWNIAIDGSAEFNDVTVRGTLQSDNYVAGVSGWQLDDGGSAEFNDVVIRGAATGNTLEIGPSNGSQILVGYSGTTSRIQFPMHSPAEEDFAVVFGRVQNSGTNSEILDLNLWSPTIDTTDDRVELSLGSGNVVGTIPARLTVALNGTTTWLLVDDTNGFNANLPVSINTATGELPLEINAPGTPGADLIDVKLGATTVFKVDSAGSMTSANTEWGTAQTPAPGGAPAQTTVNVTFAKTFPNTPRVVVTPNSAAANLNTSNIRWAVTSVSTTGFTINCWRDTNNATNFEWHAISS